ncbi:MAG: RagB/SusD family nutrient uptake outer membrane protein [Bacteroidales bacterium]
MKQGLINICMTALILISVVSCNFLEVVPPNVATLDDAFVNEKEAQKVLYSAYSFMPKFMNVRQNVAWLPTDEYIHTGDNYWFPSVNILSGENSPSQPTANYWSHYENWRIRYPLYEGIRMAYLFRDRVEGVPGINSQNAQDWKTEAEFLIAFYHFLLVRHYGPIVLIDRLIPFDAPSSETMAHRSTYDECVSWIVERLDAVAAKLPQTRSISDYGKPTKAAAKAVKSQLLLLAASPLFNGNSEYYSNFVDNRGIHLINQTFDVEKYRLAMVAAEEAIEEAMNSGCSLYQHTPSSSDEFQQAVNNARYTMVEAWNSELIWGYTGWNEDMYHEDSYQVLASPRLGDGGAPYQMMAPTLQMASRFYTKNGVPLDADPAFDYENRFKTFEEIDGEKVALFNIDREPRYYASIGYDRGYYEINNTKVRLQMRYKEQHGRQANNPNDYSMSGFLVKKGVHPQTMFENKNKRTIKRYPFPLARLGEMYLNFIESYVEYHGQLDGKALTLFNELRYKNGLPTIQESKSISTKEFSDIEWVQNERLIELAFEAHHFYDIRRWKRGEEFFGQTQNLDLNQTTPERFWRVINTVERHPRTFRTPTDYLQPLCVDDIKINSNLTQNPGYGSASN